MHDRSVSSERDPDAPAMVHFLDTEFEPEAFDTLREALRFLTTRVRPEHRGRAWIATQGSEVQMEEIVTLAAALGLKWDTSL